jgi:hypothetical protein
MRSVLKHLTVPVVGTSRRAAIEVKQPFIESPLTGGEHNALDIMYQCCRHRGDYHLEVEVGRSQG